MEVGSLKSTQQLKAICNWAIIYPNQLLIDSKLKGFQVLGKNLGYNQGSLVVPPRDDFHIWKLVV
jgi:hypothetical protein